MAGEDPAYVAFVKTHRCRFWMNDPCNPTGRVDPHHDTTGYNGPRGLSQKAHDNTCVPLCRRHHDAWHEHRGIFAEWTKDERRRWAAKQIRRMRRLWRRYMAGRADVL